MTEVPFTEPTEDNEDVTPEETAAAEAISLKDLGIEPLTTPIPTLLKIYRENHSTVQEYVKKQKSATKADATDPHNLVKNRVESAIKSEEAKAIIEDVNITAEAVAERTFAIPHNLLTSTVLLSELENLVSLLREEVRYHFDAAVQKEKTKQGITSTPAESAVQAKLVCVKLRSLIENRVNIAKMMDMELPSDLFKVAEEGKRGGFNTEVFPKTPRLETEVSSTTVSSSAHLRFRFVPVSPDGTDLEPIAVPDGMTLRQVAHDFVSAGAYRVSAQTIESMLKKAGHGIGATDTEWSLSFKTGTLYGMRVAG